MACVPQHSSGRLLHGPARSPTCQTGSTSPFCSSLTNGHLIITSVFGRSPITIFIARAGTAQPGRLLAIMGPSGSGKTSLLNALSGQMPQSKHIKLTGELLVNGTPRSQSTHRQGFVTQEDVFYSQMTVKVGTGRGLQTDVRCMIPHLADEPFAPCWACTLQETLMMTAKLRLPTETPETEVESYVDNLINTLGLTKSKDTIVGDKKARGLSGGEKKRLSVACELIGSPSLIYADEPTTGLDSFQARRRGSVIGNRHLATEPRGAAELAPLPAPSGRECDGYVQGPSAPGPYGRVCDPPAPLVHLRDV